MDRIIEVKVNGGYLSMDSRKAGNQHEANITKLRITFDAGWDGFAKTLTFWNAKGQNPVKRILTEDLLEVLTNSGRVYICTIPGEALTESGMMTFTIDGYVNGVRQRTLRAELEVEESPYLEHAGEPADPTPSQAEQLQVQIDTLLGDMQAEARKAEEAADNAAQSENFAAMSASAAQTAAENAAMSEASAKASETAAGEYMEEAKTVAEDAANVAAANIERQISAYTEQVRKDAESAAKSAKDAAESAAQAGEIAGGDIGAVAAEQISAHNRSEEAHADIRQAVDGKVPWINACSSNYDMDVIMRTPNKGLYMTDGSTLGTPKQYGKTAYASALILTYTDGNYGIQVAYSAGQFVFTRKIDNGTLGAWCSVYTEDNKPTAADVGAVETKKNLTPESVGYATLLRYMASRYDEHVVVYANVSGFSDMPTGVTSGQAVLNMMDGILTATLYTRTAVYTRGTNDLSSWTGNWRKVYDEDNKPTYTASEVGAAPATHNHDAGHITSGTLSVARGGTGVTSLDALATALGAARIASGSYVGTGTYGEANALTLSFNFPVKLLVFTNIVVASGSYAEPPFLNSTARDCYIICRVDAMTTEYMEGWGFGYDQNEPPFGKRSGDGKSVSWYQKESGRNMFNESGRTYHYVAFG